MTHILERAIIHIFSATSAYLLAWFTLQWALRKWPVWTPIVLPAILACAIIGNREAFDVANGQPLIKVFTDAVSWIIGMGLAIWGLHRFKKLNP
jgi:hypothetical protein